MPFPYPTPSGGSFEVAQPSLMLLECVGMGLLLSSCSEEKIGDTRVPSRQRDSVLQRPHGDRKPARYGLPGVLGVHHPHATWRRTLATLEALALTHAHVC